MAIGCVKIEALSDTVRVESRWPEEMPFGEWPDQHWLFSEIGIV
jgi:hypothetical protein